MYRNAKSRQMQSGRIQALMNMCTSRLAIPDILTNYMPKTKVVKKKKMTATKRDIKSEFVTVNHVPVRVDCWGTHTPTSVEKNPETKPEKLILVVPGNPGVTRFYYRFIDELYSKTSIPVWIISHGGHDKVQSADMRPPSVRRNKDLYTVQGQVQQKKELIETYLKDVKVYCIGHSIGCKMLLEALNQSEVADIEQCYFLFPTVQGMAETRNGKIVSFVIKYILWLVLLGSYIFIYLPTFLQVLLLRVYCLVVRMPPDNISSLLQLIDPHVLNNVFYLAHDELVTVVDLNDEAVKKNAKRLRFYYGATDGWTPLNYYRELTEKHPSVKAEICTRGYQHAFVLRQSKELATLVADWINS